MYTPHVEGAVVATDDSDAEMYYTDALTGNRRRRKGARKTRSRGPYSGGERKAKEEFARMVNVYMHKMDGQLTDAIYSDLIAWFASSAAVMSRYSYGDLPNPTVEDLNALREELDFARRLGKDPGGEEEFDEEDLT